jgi:predicted dehydrogenase
MANNTLRWGLLSTARINERLIPVIRATPRCELVAVASSGGMDKARRYAAEWQIPGAFGSYEEMLADPHIDVVYLPLPNSLHAPWAIKAARAGKHVLCEKPLALTVEELDQMGAAARASGIVLQDGAMMRYHPQTWKVAELIAQKAIGEVRLIRGLFTFTLTRLDDIRFDPALGGGALWDLGSYCVNFMRTALRAEPAEVQGWQITSDRGVDLSFTGCLFFASGVTGHFHCSFQATASAQADILGSKGTIHLDLPWVNKIGVTSHIRVVRGAAPQPVGRSAMSPPRCKRKRLHSKTSMVIAARWKR